MIAIAATDLPATEESLLLPVAQRLSGMLREELGAVQRDRELYARIDNEGMISAAARKSAFQDAARRLAEQIAARLSPAAARPPALEQELARVRTLGQALRAEERINQHILERVRGLVEGYVEAIAPKEALTYGRGGRTQSTYFDRESASRVSRRT